MASLIVDGHRDQWDHEGAQAYLEVDTLAILEACTECNCHTDRNRVEGIQVALPHVGLVEGTEASGVAGGRGVVEETVASRDPQGV